MSRIYEILKDTDDRRDITNFISCMVEILRSSQHLEYINSSYVFSNIKMHPKHRMHLYYFYCISSFKILKLIDNLKCHGVAIMNVNKIENVVIYTRVSTEGQIDGYSLDAQKEDLIKYCNRFGYSIVGEYQDAGISGTNIKK